jgi:hypothetical protein
MVATDTVRGVRGPVVQDAKLLKLYSAIASAVTALAGDEELVNTLQVPQMVVTGGQSAGKTSFIESMVNFRVGPTDKGTATRCPVRYVLRNDAGSEVKYFVDDELIAGATNEEKRERLRNTVLKNMDRMCGMKFSETPIVVQIQDPDVVNMDIIDLPGLQDPKEPTAQEIGKIVRSYLTIPNVIPVVIAKAEKSADTQMDVAQLEDHGLILSNALLIVNQFNKQLVDLHSIDDVQDWMMTYKKKFKDCRAIRFVMLLHNITGPGIDKDKMSQAEVEQYYAKLPMAELTSFKAHLAYLKQTSAQKGKAPSSITDDQLLKDFGVVKAHETMVSILRDWTVGSGAAAAGVLQQRLRPFKKQEHQLRQRANEVKKFFDSLEGEVKSYAKSYLSTMKDLRLGKVLALPAAEKGVYRKQDIYVDNEECKITLSTELKSYEMDKFTNTEKAFDKFAQLPHDLDPKKTFTGDLMGHSLPCNRGVDRLLDATGIVVMKAPMKEIREDQIQGLASGYGSMCGTTDTTQHVTTLVRENLRMLFPEIFDFLLHHAQQLIKLPQEHAHKNLIAHSYPHMGSFHKFRRALDAAFTDWLDKQCEKLSVSLQDMLEEKISGVVVDIDTRLINLLALVEDPTDGLADLKSLQDLPAHQQKAYRINKAIKEALVELKSQPLKKDTVPVLQTSAAPAATGKQPPAKGSKTSTQTKSSVQEEIVTEVFESIGMDPIAFVEGGFVSIPQRLRGMPLAEFANRYARKYFHYYKGLILLDIECKVRHHLMLPLEHMKGGNDDLHVKMEEVAASMFVAPKALPDEFDEEVLVDPTNAVAPIQELRDGFDSKELRSEIKGIRNKINKVEDVLTHLTAITGRSSSRL